MCYLNLHSNKPMIKIIAAVIFFWLEIDNYRCYESSFRSYLYKWKSQNLKLGLSETKA